MFSRYKLTAKIIKYGRMCGEKNFTPGYSGNISARYKDGMLITTSGSSNGHLKRNNIVYTGFNGLAEEKSKRTSSEKFLHIEIYKKREDINFIIHVHPPYLSAFASAGRDLLPPVMAENVYYFGGIPIAKYALPSSKELALNTAKFFEDHDAVLMSNHGFVIGSETVEDAYMKLELAEAYARTILCTELLGGAKVLSEKQASDILKLR